MVLKSHPLINKYTLVMSTKHKNCVRASSTHVTLTIIRVNYDWGYLGYVKLE